jgi:hypothetical protein
MKLALVFCLAMFLASAWTYSGAQDKPAQFCNGKSVPIATLPEPRMNGVRLQLRSGGDRDFPKIKFLSDTPLQFVIRNRPDFVDFWKRAIIYPMPGVGFPPMPEIDFSKEMLVAVVMGNKPTIGYWIYIDGACEVDDHLNIFATSIDASRCFQSIEGGSAEADIVILPRTDLPVIFREMKVGCNEWSEQVRRFTQRNLEDRWCCD